MNLKISLAALLAAAPLPSAAVVDQYKVDPEHTYPSLEFSHMGISVWRGKFTKTSGSVAIDRAAKIGTVEVVVDAASIDFGLAAMNDMARSDNFFNAAKYPTASYKGTIKFAGDKPKSVEGQVTIMGVTRPANLNINLFNCITHPLLKKELCGADAEGELNWSEYGMKMSEFGQGEAGKVRLRIQVEALKQN